MLARIMTAAIVLFFLHQSHLVAAVIEDFDAPDFSLNGRILYAAAPYYDGITNSDLLPNVTGGDFNGDGTNLNPGFNGRITQAAYNITADQSGGGYYLHNQTGGPAVAGEVWGTLTPIHVVQDSTCDFSFYLANDNLTNVAQIRPYINGAPIAGPVSASGQNTWQKFSFSWTTNATTTAVLSLRNTIATGVGNDFGLDTIEFSCLSEPQPVTVNALKNFDIVNNAGDVNDFHIKLQGVAPTQIASVYPPPSIYNQYPPGWTPETIMPMGPDTAIMWGPGQMIGSPTTLHFGVSLTAAGTEDLQGICMTWTRDGQPVYQGGDPNMPIAITPNPLIPGESEIQIVNQICPDRSGGPVIVGPISTAILDRHAALGDLVAESPIIAGAIPVIDEFTLLEPGASINLPVPATFADSGMLIGDGDSMIVVYRVFENNNGMPGRLVGASYNAFNMTAFEVPQPLPGDYDFDDDVDGADLGVWKSQFGQTGAGLNADGDIDGDVDGNDFLTWQRQLGSGLPPSAAIPEPPSFLVLLTAVLCAMASNRR
jgi:hypothetical protein